MAEYISSIFIQQMWQIHEPLVLCNLALTHIRLVLTEPTADFPRRAFVNACRLCINIKKHRTKRSYFVYLARLPVTTMLYLHIKTRFPNNTHKAIVKCRRAMIGTVG